MLQIILFKLGLMKKYQIVYNGLIVHNENETIDFYYYKKCPEYLLKWEALKWIKGKVQTNISNVIYIESIGDIKYHKQFIY